MKNSIWNLKFLAACDGGGWVGSEAWFHVHGRLVCGKGLYGRRWLSCKALSLEGPRWKWQFPGTQTRTLSKTAWVTGSSTGGGLEPQKSRHCQRDLIGIHWLKDWDIWSLILRDSPMLYTGSHLPTCPPSSADTEPWVPRQAPLSMGILQARILEWVAMFFSRRSSQPRDWTQVSWLQVNSLPAELPGKLATLLHQN